MAHKVRVALAHPARASTRAFDAVFYAAIALWAGGLIFTAVMIRSSLWPVGSLWGVAIAGASALSLLAWASLLSRIRFRKA